MGTIKTKEEFKRLFYYDKKNEMYVFSITEDFIIIKEVMERLPLETLKQLCNRELDTIKRKLMQRAENSRLN